MHRTDPIEVLVRQSRWRAALRAIVSELKVTRQSHWLLARLALMHYELHDYRAAREYAKRAMTLEPRCHLALWEYAGALQMLGRHREAVKVYRRLTHRGAERIASGPCGEGLARARGLVADCHYRIASSLRALGARQAAGREFRRHLGMRLSGSRSIYSLRELASDGWRPNMRLELTPPRRGKITFVNGTARRRSSAASR